MEATIIECPFGVLAFNSENKLVEKILFPKRPGKAAEIFAKIEGGRISKEVIKLIKTLRKKGYDSLLLENSKLAQEIEKSSVKVKVSKPSKINEMLRSRMKTLAVETGFLRNAEAFDRWMHDFTLEIAKVRVRKAVEKRDVVIIQAIQTLDDLDKAVNLFMGRAREWYGTHFPELDRLLNKHETYARLVYKLGSKDNFTQEKLEKEGIPKSTAKDIAKSTETSMGADLTKIDLEQIQSLCKNILDQYQLRQTLEDYLETIMEEVAPNVKAIAGPLLGARLIALTGGLTNLAKKPSSTIQVLGAEKALFRSLKTGTSPPKHGIIFQHALIHEAQRGRRGKIARAIAGKLAIAARVDAFGSRYIGEKLKTELDKKVEEIT